MNGTAAIACASDAGAFKDRTKVVCAANTVNMPAGKVWHTADRVKNSKGVGAINSTLQNRNVRPDAMKSFGGGDVVMFTGGNFTTFIEGVALRLVGPNTLISAKGSRIAAKKAVVTGCAVLAFASPAFAQSNKNDSTQLGSRIKKNDLPPYLTPRLLENSLKSANRERSRSMMGQFSRCLYNRSNEKSLDFLTKTDLGLVNFEQIGMTFQQVSKIYGFDDCLSRVAYNQASGIVMRYTADGLRKWLLQAAYFAQFPDSADWVVEGGVIGERKFPLSADNQTILSTVAFADCVVAKDPYSSDLYFRAERNSEAEKQALTGLMPSLGGCIPKGMEIKIQPESLKVWLGEGLWHAATHIGATKANISEVTN